MKVLEYRLLAPQTQASLDRLFGQNTFQKEVWDEMRSLLAVGAKAEVEQPDRIITFFSNGWVDITPVNPECFETYQICIWLPFGFNGTTKHFRSVPFSQPTYVVWNQANNYSDMMNLTWYMKR